MAVDPTGWSDAKKKVFVLGKWKKGEQDADYMAVLNSMDPDSVADVASIMQTTSGGDQQGNKASPLAGALTARKSGTNQKTAGSSDFSLLDALKPKTQGPTIAESIKAKEAEEAAQKKRQSQPISQLNLPKIAPNTSNVGAAVGSGMSPGIGILSANDANRINVGGGFRTNNQTNGGMGPGLADNTTAKEFSDYMSDESFIPRPSTTEMAAPGNKAWYSEAPGSGRSGNNIYTTPVNVTPPGTTSGYGSGTNFGGTGAPSPGMFPTAGKASDDILSPSGAGAYGYGTSTNFGGTGAPTTNTDPSQGVYTGGAGAYATPTPGVFGPGGLSGLLGGALGGLGQGISDLVAAGANANPYGYPGAFPTAPSIDTSQPDIPMPQIPDINLKYRDFTPQGKQMASEAYAPLYKAYEEGKSNATAQEKTSDAVVKGMYANLAADTKAGAQATDTRYDAAVAQNQKQGTQAVADTNTQFNAQQQALANELKAAGADQNTIKQTLAQNASQQAQANQVLSQNTAAVTGNLNTNAETQADYATQTASADASTGNADRQNLLSELSNVLSNFDQQKLGTKSDEIKNSQEIANNLATQDFSAQSANASQQMAKYNAAMGQTGVQIDAANRNQDLRNKAAQDAYSYQVEAWKYKEAAAEAKQAGDTDRAAAMAKAALDAQKEADDATARGRQLDIDKQNADSRTTTANTGAGAAATKNADPYTQMSAQAASALQTSDSTKVGSAIAFIQSIADGWNLTNKNAQMPPGYLLAQARQNAAKGGMNPQQAEAVASAFLKYYQTAAPTNTGLVNTPTGR